MGRRTGDVRRNPKLPFLWFALANTMLLISFILLFYVYIYNYPSWAPDNTPVGQMGTAAWLCTLNTTLPGSEDAVRGHVKYGFGTFGWCSWGSTIDGLTDTATCNGGGAWSIPDSAPPMDDVVNLNLPPAVAKAMFPCAVLLIIPAVIGLILWIVHSFTLRYPHDEAPPVFPNYAKKDATSVLASKNIRVRCACLIRGFWYGFGLWLASTALIIPAIACAVAAVSHYKGVNGIGYRAKLGTGTFCLIAVICLQLGALIVIWTGGLWHRKMTPKPYQ